MRYVTPVIKYGQKVFPKIGKAIKETPSKVKKFASDAFSKAHKSEQWAQAANAVNDMKWTTLGEVGKKFTTKTGIGISAGVAGGTVGYMAGKKKKKNRYA